MVEVEVVAVVQRAERRYWVGIRRVGDVAAVVGARGVKTVQSPLEAAEAREHAALHGVVEAEIARAGSERQSLGNQVVVPGGEEGELLNLTHLVLVEGGVIALHPRVPNRGARDRPDVGQAAGIA